MSIMQRFNPFASQRYDYSSALAVPDTTSSNKTLLSFSVLLSLVFLIIFNSPAHAATPDMSEIVTMITGLVAVVSSIGMAVLTVYATAKVFKWVKTAF
jgi:hypothetical protein